MSANNTERKIQNLLRQHHFVLVRQAKHFVYQEPQGRVFVTSANTLGLEGGRERELKSPAFTVTEMKFL